MNQKQIRNITLQKIDTDENYFEGRACQYNIKDSYGTTFMPGCFTRGGLDKKTYSLLWNHDYSKPVGTFYAEEREDGLYIVGRWDENTAGRDARVAAISGSASDLSVGFTWIIESDADQNNEIIRNARLQEVSQVTSRFAAVPGSSLTSVRNTENTEEERWTTVYPSGTNKPKQSNQGSPEAEQEETQTIVPEATEAPQTVEETQDNQIVIEEVISPLEVLQENEETIEETITQPIDIILEPESEIESEPEEDVKSKKKKKVAKSIIAINGYIQSLF